MVLFAHQCGHVSGTICPSVRTREWYYAIFATVYYYEKKSLPVRMHIEKILTALVVDESWNQNSTYGRC